MTLLVSETSLVANGPSFQMGGCSQIVLHDEDDSSEVLDIDEYIPNREVVNLENADVNIQGSTGVTIGPVTHVNVSGNVTIYSNGNVADDVEHKSIESGEHKPGINSHAKLGKCGKSESEEDLKRLTKHKKTIRIFLSISFALLVTIGTVVLILHFTNHIFNKEDPNFGPTTPGSNDNDNIGNHQVLDRTHWGGRPPLSYINITSPVPMVIIKHTGAGYCDSFQVCAGKVYSMQSQGIIDGLPDIKYNFLIGGDGNIYVGRGWDVQPAYRNDTIDIAFIGTYTYDVLTPSMIEAAQLLIEDGLNNNKLTQDYKLVAHNQTTAQISPGPNVFKEIVTWPHYDGGLYFNNKNLEKAGGEAY
ncbi:hypothetical protein NQ315_000928 [Exocentrus adspersus]|uniref:Uncharacterized protein n=1 Tax=Exocentrus adspersus TaxID=1586481 RepID=A0AAV8WDJ6_9CUCU|nr:hypothetical protein NQ315_000928 [Exocentrus adspersus]